MNVVNNLNCVFFGNPFTGFPGAFSNLVKTVLAAFGKISKNFGVFSSGEVLTNIRISQEIRSTKL